MIQLAQVAAVLGPLPRDMLEAAGPRALQVFNSDGTAKHNAPSRTLESLVDESLKARFKLTGKHDELSADEQKQLLSFIRRCLTWNPDKRATAEELLEEPLFSTYAGMETIPPKPYLEMAQPE
jgi:serine/threonine-protein kinase SRPK3